MQTVLLYLQLEALERPEGLPVTYLDVHRRGSLSSSGQRPNIRKVPCLRASSCLRSVRPLSLSRRQLSRRVPQAGRGGARTSCAWGLGGPMGVLAGDGAGTDQGLGGGHGARAGGPGGSSPAS